MDLSTELKQRLQTYTKDDIIITRRARIRMQQRQINEKEVVENIINPVRLEYAAKQASSTKKEEKFDCYFRYTRNLCHRYVLVIKKQVIVVTVIKINKKWQKMAERKVRPPR